MAHHGTGFVPIPPTPPIATDYSWNWVNMNHGTGIVPTPTGLVGGPGGFYLDFGQPVTEPPEGSTSVIWTGAAWVSADAAQVRTATGWAPLAGSKVRTGTGWVVV